VAGSSPAGGAKYSLITKVFRLFCFNIMFTVYILFSKKLGRYYVGQTKDFSERFFRHNNSEMKYTKKGVPWFLVSKIEVDSRSAAVILESKIKKRGAKRYLHDNDISPVG
ncbi:MAG: GIY-YIG nuclease family protein, partial [Bacteroidota bacterium]